MTLSKFFRRKKLLITCVVLVFNASGFANQDKSADEKNLEFALAICGSPENNAWQASKERVLCIDTVSGSLAEGKTPVESMRLGCSKFSFPNAEHECLKGISAFKYILD